MHARFSLTHACQLSISIVPGLFFAVEEERPGTICSCIPRKVGILDIFLFLVGYSLNSTVKYLDVYPVTRLGTMAKSLEAGYVSARRMTGLPALIRQPRSFPKWPPLHQQREFCRIPGNSRPTGRFAVGFFAPKMVQEHFVLRATAPFSVTAKPIILAHWHV